MHRPVRLEHSLPSAHPTGDPMTALSRPLAPAVLDTAVARKDARADLHTTLQRWHDQGFIRPGWQLEWDPGHGQWLVEFELLVQAEPLIMTASEFAVYRLGFEDRRRAVMARPPQTATSGGAHRG